MVTEIEVARSLQTWLNADMGNYSIPRERRINVVIKPASLRKAVKNLVEGYNPRFVTISAIDHGLDIELLYHFSIGGIVATLQATIPKEANEIDTITDMTPAAHFIEREINDLFGVKFRDHPEQRRLVLPGDWPPGDHPLRKPHEGVIPPSARLPVETLLSTGCLTTVSSYVKQRRERVGLPPAPPAVCSEKELLPEFQEIMRQTGFDGKAGYDWGKKKLRYK